MKCRQETLLGELLPKTWRRLPQREEPETGCINAMTVTRYERDPDDKMPDIEIDLEQPLWEHFKQNPVTTVDGSILYGNCGVPGYSREACWQPIIDDLCVSCIYHKDNDPDNREEWEDEDSRMG